MSDWGGSRDGRSRGGGGGGGVRKSGGSGGGVGGGGGPPNRPSLILRGATVPEDVQKVKNVCIRSPPSPTPPRNKWEVSMSVRVLCVV